MWLAFVHRRVQGSNRIVLHIAQPPVAPVSSFFPPNFRDRWDPSIVAEGCGMEYAASHYFLVFGYVSAVAHYFR